MRTLLLSLALSSCAVDSEPSPPSRGEATAPPAEEAPAPSQTHPLVDERPPCEHLACAIGLRPAEANLGAEVRRHGRWVELEGGVWYQTSEGRISRVQLRPCAPLRGDDDWLRRHGFAAENARIIHLRDARGIEGIEGFWLEGRGASCTLSAR